MSAGYSGKPLAQKLGIKPDTVWVVHDAPADYAQLLGALPAGVRIATRAPRAPRQVHIFVTEQRVLADYLARYRPRLQADGFLWVSWPKKSAKLPTDITEDTIRRLALPLGFVDIKVCAVSEIWSGLKLVIRKDAR